MDKRPIGIFDSGLGGITVLKEIIKLVPGEDIIYFGDTARFPYGPRELEEVKNFAINIAKFLYEQSVKLIVIACNTSTAAALTDIQNIVNIPVVGVIEPGARAAVNATKIKRVGVIATKGTIESKAYDRAINKIDKNVKVFSNSAPLLVDYVEDGILSGKLLEKTIFNYLKPLLIKSIDVLLLGCTHFPLIEDSIKVCCNNKLSVISSASETAKDVKEILINNNLYNELNNTPKRIFYETGNDSKFYDVGKIFLGEKIKEVIKVELKM